VDEQMSAVTASRCLGNKPGYANWFAKLFSFQQRVSLAIACSFS
jgi:hypothetical protein